MWLLALGVVGFSALHLVAAHHGLKAALRARWGARVFGAVYGAASLATIGLIILGWRAAPIIPVYDPPSWGAVGHLLANGDGASLVLFGGLGVYAVAHVVVARSSGARPPPLASGHNAAGLLVGLGLYGLMLHFHQALIGVSVPFFGG